MAITYRLFEHTKDLEQQRRLFRACFPENVNASSDSHEHYFWKFHSFPAELKSYEYGAYDGDELIGYYAAIPYRYTINGAPKLCGMVCDVMTHPKMRGRGVFTGIGHFATDAMKQAGVDFVTGYPIRPEVIPGHLKVGWKIVFNLPMYIRPVRFNSFLPKTISFLAFAFNPFLNIFHFVIRLINRRNSNYHCEILNREGFSQLKEYEAFFRKWKGQQSYSLVKDLELIKWRTHAPGTDYRFIVVKEKNEMVGMAIARNTVLRNIPTLAVLDLMILKGRLDCRSWIEGSLMRLAAEFRADALVTMMSRFWAKAYNIKKIGFIKSPYEFSLIIKNLNPAMDDAASRAESNWHLMWLDSDDL